MAVKRTIYFVGTGAYENWGPSVGFEDEADAEGYIERQTQALKRNGYSGMDAWPDGPHALEVYTPGGRPDNDVDA